MERKAKSKPINKAISFKVTEDNYKLLNDISNEIDLSKSDLIRESITYYLKNKHNIKINI